MLSGGLSSALPDDRPVTSLCVIEQVSRCPGNYSPVLKTYDQDVDADLWKDGFWRRETRYLCLSKTQHSASDPVAVVELVVVGEREALPHGHVQIPHTADTGNRSWKRKHIVYRESALSSASRYVVDIIVLSRQKSCPDGFCLVGELNGLTICCKYANNPSFKPAQPSNQNISSHSGAMNGYAAVGSAGVTSTLTQAYCSLDGVVFRAHDRLQSALDQQRPSSVDLDALTADYPLSEKVLDELVSYDFSTEYAVIQQS